MLYGDRLSPGKPPEHPRVPERFATGVHGVLGVDVVAYSGVEVPWFPPDPHSTAATPCGFISVAKYPPPSSLAVSASMLSGMTVAVGSGYPGYWARAIASANGAL